MDNLQEAILKGYKLQERIGSGGFGAVYRAKQTTIGREVAVKIILPGYANNPDFIRRFESEAQLVARLEHPHITPLIDFWRDPQGAYLVMRFLRGGSVRDALQNDNYDLHAVSQLLDQISSALDFAHRNNVIHRDIKPGNILLDEDSNAYLADFGIAKDLSGLTSNNTGKDVVVGSLDYISPEQARSEPVTPRTDIYSLGVTLYEIITGEHPFKSASPIERLYKHINDPLPQIDNLPDDLREVINDIIQKATAKNPEHRYADVLALAIAFREGIGRGATQQNVNIVEQLTMREQEILALISSGKSNNEIASRLVITVSTVKWHITQLYKKLGVRSRMQAIVRARELNLVVTGATSGDLSFLQEAPSDISLPEPENPYKGLHAFQMTDARDFFGRDDLTKKLIEQMQDDSDPYHRFLAIVGPSGSGKSSLVKAGVVPALWNGAIEGSEKWFVVDMIPGTHPVDKLETALIRVAANQANNLREQLQRDERGLLRVADIILPGDDSELVIVVDQFEEVFTLVDNEAIRQQFLDLIRVAVSDVRSRVRVIVTLRADYYDRPLHYPEFGNLVRTQMETVMPLSAKGLERAVRGPAERVGVTFEQGLVAQIVSSMNYQAGALPLLQYALTELFDRRKGRLLTNEAYQQIGGAVGALANRADEIFNSLTDEAQELAHQMFMRLVTLGEGAEDTRRRANHAEILSLTHNTDLMEEIIDQFAAYRLLSLDHDPETRLPTIEVAHEAILREWERLRYWLNESREEIRQERAVSHAADEWTNNNRDTSYLLRGSRLEQVQKWHELTDLMLTPLESEFIATSITQHETDMQVEAQRKTREAAQEKRSRTLLRALVAVFALATLLSGGFGVFALSQRNNAVEAQAETVVALDLAERSGMAFAANAALEITEIDLAVALALESVGDDEANMLPETLRILERIENQAGPRIWRERGSFACSPRFSRDRRYYIWSDCQNSISVWDIQTAEELIELTPPEPFNFQSYFFAQFSQDGKRLLLAHLEDWPGTFEVLLLDMETWDTIATYTIESPISWLYFTGDSSIIATMEIAPENLALAQEENIIIGDAISLRDAETGVIIRQYRFENQWIQDFDLSLDGTLGVVNGWSGFDGPRVDEYRAIVFDMETGDTLYTFDRPHNENYPESSNWSASAGFSADGTKLSMSGYPNYIIDIATGENYGQISQLEGFPMRSPDPDFQYVMNQDMDFNPQLFNIETGEIETFHVNFAYLGAEPATMLTADLGRMDEFQIWDVAGRPSNTDSIRQRSAVSGVKYSPDGRYLAVVNSGWGCVDINNQENAIYDAETLEEVGHLDGDANMVWGLDWSPDNRFIATATFNEAILWDAATGQEIRRFSGTQDCIMRLKFSNDGRYLFGAHGSWFPDNSYDVPPYLIMWDVETGEEVRRYEFPVDKTPNWGIVDLALHPTRNIAVVGISLQFTEGCEEGECDFVSYILNLDTGNVTEVAVPMIGAGFIADGQEIIGTALPNIIYVVDTETGAVIRQWNALDSQIFGRALSPDGRYFVTGVGALAFESAISLWDVETGDLLRRYFSEGQQTFVINIDFHPDGTRFVSSAFEPVVRFWEVDTQTTLDWVRENRVVREFTCIEREQYRIEPLCEE